MAVNQQQIANKLNLSVATISRSLKNDRAINERTRARVAEAARAMGYDSPLMRAQALIDADKDVLPVCAIFQTEYQPGSVTGKDNLATGYLTGMSAAICHVNSSLIVHYVPMKNRDLAFSPELLPSALRNGKVSGVVLIHYYPPEQVRELAARHSCVSMVYDYDIPGMDIVNVNDRGAIIALMKKLHEHGHRRIAFAGEMKNHCWARIRFAGYAEAVMALEMEFLPENIFDFSDGIYDGEQIVQLKNRIAGGVTALVCANDDMAYNLIRKLRTLGIETPRDVSVTGFDRIQNPPDLPLVTSIQLPAEEMGEGAIRMLLDRNRAPGKAIRRLMFDAAVASGDTVADVKS